MENKVCQRVCLTDLLLCHRFSHQIAPLRYAAKVSHKAYEENLSLKEACVSLGFLSAEKFDEVFKPEEMAGVKK